MKVSNILVIAFVILIAIAFAFLDRPRLSESPSDFKGPTGTPSVEGPFGPPPK